MWRAHESINAWNCQLKKNLPLLPYCLAQLSTLLPPAWIHYFSSFYHCPCSLSLITITRTLQCPLCWNKRMGFLCCLPTSIVFVLTVDNNLYKGHSSCLWRECLFPTPSSFCTMFFKVLRPKAKEVWVDRGLRSPASLPPALNWLLRTGTRLPFRLKTEVTVDGSSQPTSVRVPKPSHSGGISLFKQILAIILISSCSFLLFSGGRRRQQIWKASIAIFSFCSKPDSKKKFRLLVPSPLDWASFLTVLQLKLYKMFSHIQLSW